MSPLWEDLKARPIVEKDGQPVMMFIREDERTITPFELWAGPTGALCLRRPEPVPIDQVGEREKKSPRDRWAAAGFTE